MGIRITALAVSTLFASAALADATIIMNESHQGMPGGKGQTKMLVKNGKLVMEQVGQKETVLFDSATQSMTQVDHGRKEYMVMDDEALDEAQSQMSEMMKQMEEQLAGMSKEQREMVMQQMPQGLPGMNKRPPQKIEIKSLGRGDKVAGYKCKMVEMHKGGTLDSTACIASARSLGLSKGDFMTISKMIEMMQSFADRFGQADDDIPSLEEMGGLPIMSSEADGSSKSVLVSVDLGKLDAVIFEIPADYSERSMTQQ